MRSVLSVITPLLKDDGKLIEAVDHLLELALIAGGLGVRPLRASCLRLRRTKR